MANKDKKRQNKISKASSQEISPAQILLKFKSAWANKSFLAALSLYRTWINKTGKKSDPEIECELLLRSAEEMHASLRPEHAIGLLDEAIAKENNGSEKFEFYKAVICTQTGKLESALGLFENISDDFHASILRALIEAKKTLPKKINPEARFDQSELSAVWNAITGTAKPGAWSRALGNFISAYEALATGEDPEPGLVILKKKPGWESVASYLLLLVSVFQRRNIKIRNILKANTELAATSSWNELIRIHMEKLLGEGTHAELLAISEIVDRSNTRIAGVDRLLDEALFRASLDEIAGNRFELALEYLLKIRTKTQAVRHNIGLCYEKLEKYWEANDYWIQLIKAGQKPKRNDTKDIRTAYAGTCNHIARNYREEGDLQKALAYFKESLLYIEDDKESMLEICEIYTEMERHNEAFQYAKRLIEIDPEKETHLLLYSTEARLAGKTDEILVRLEDFCAKHPENNFFSTYTAMIYIDEAWRLWNERAIGMPELSKRIMHIRNFKPDFPECRILYLEAVTLEAAGNKKTANKLVRRAIGQTKLHRDECDLGFTLYTDGREADAADLLMKAASCTCEESFFAVEEIISFFIEKEDRKYAKLFCDYMIEKKKDPPGFIADLLIDNGWPDMALVYSRMEIERGGDQNDYYRHFTILNMLGNKDDTLDFADDFLAKAEEKGDERNVRIIKQLIKEVRAKGRFRE